MKLSEIKIGKKVSVKADYQREINDNILLIKQVQKLVGEINNNLYNMGVKNAGMFAGRVEKEVADLLKAHEAQLKMLKTAPTQHAGEIFLQGKDFKLSATDKHFSARQPSMDGEVSIPDSSWGVRAKKAAFDWISKNQDAIKQMTFDQFNSALYKAVGKWPHTYNQMD